MSTLLTTVTAYPCFESPVAMVHIAMETPGKNEATMSPICVDIFLQTEMWHQKIGGWNIFF